MNGSRRISIEIEQRKLTFSLTRAATPEPASRTASEGNCAEFESTSLCTSVCSSCGAPWIEVMGLDGSDLDAIYRALLQHGLHLHSSTAGPLRICSKSLEEIRFEETKESL